MHEQSHAFRIGILDKTQGTGKDDVRSSGEQAFANTGTKKPEAWSRQQQQGTAAHYKGQEIHELVFTTVLPEHATQEQVFKEVAEPVVESCLNGYNGTIFAYGQTGSGKTFTMSGSESWKQRGIVPRTFEFIFDELERRKHLQYNVYASYLEIYNENGYDLLDHKHAESSFDDWNKIALFEDDLGNVHLKNLSIHKVASEDDAIDLLMMGNFIRQVSSTPMNMASSRSHCIFTLAFESRDLNSGLVKTSKLHLVDLAGSERVFKKNSQGAIIEEAKHINLSLSYLEQVIIALHEKAQGNRVHIPYRNSMMTTILRDSLGGNCRTVMIANISAEMDNIDESVSTARFAQRCSMLVNEVHMNQHMDLNLIIKKLEEENTALKRELGLASSGGSLRRDLTVDELEKTEAEIEKFMEGEGEIEPTALTKEELAYGIKYMRQLVLEREEKYQREVEELRKQLNIMAKMSSDQPGNFAGGHGKPLDRKKQKLAKAIHELGETPKHVPPLKLYRESPGGDMAQCC
eukprot:TRINITY_DN105369_c0_g1_i1.p1 TRINITY_DN105369_c0_g1~~TRINITY_DN105369_c0_g1_i1.p1  ORF type:complete len:518 (-),score=45.91 TRINITY_DN105369_c0_g1_i1:930-2483(-)